MTKLCASTFSFRPPFLARRVTFSCGLEPGHEGDHRGAVERDGVVYEMTWAGRSFTARKSQRVQVVPPGRVP